MKGGYEPERFSWLRSNWWEPVKREALAVRERAGLMDLSTFSKYEITGPDAASFLSRICANRIPPKDDVVVLTHLLTPAGYVESEITVTRLAHDRFYVLSAAAAQLHDKDQFEWRKSSAERVAVADVTDDFGVLVLAGPRSREVLAQATAADLSNAAFRWLTATVACVAGVEGVRLLRINYVGELGWELHVPMARLPAVYQAVMAAGEPHQLRLFGTYAMNSLRMEKAYRGWGSELSNEVTLAEAGMERFIDYGKDFVGKGGSLSLKERGPRWTLIYLQVDATDADCLGSEPVYLDGQVVGVTTSGAYGFAVNKSLAFAYVAMPLESARRDFQVMVRGDLVNAWRIPECAWDPGNERVRA